MAYPQSHAIQSMQGLHHFVSHPVPVQPAYSYQIPAQFPSAAHIGIPSEQPWNAFYSNVPNLPVVSPSRLVDCIPYASASTMRRDWRCAADGPRVTHSPIASLSPNLMEGERMTRRGTPVNAWQPVTISEDDMGDAEIEHQYADHSPRHIISMIP